VGLYLAVMLDLFSHAIVGWSTSERIDARLVCSALIRALWRYRPLSELIIHSDRGSQYTSEMFQAMFTRQPISLLQSHGLSCYDNAVADLFFTRSKPNALCLRTISQEPNLTEVCFNSDISVLYVLARPAA